MAFSIKKAWLYDGYIASYCEQIFNDNNVPEHFFIKGIPERMAFESKIWAVGETIRKHILTTSKDRVPSIILPQIVDIINTDKYRRGRESFVMLLHFFKHETSVTDLLKGLLHDSSLYGYSVMEMNRIGIYTEREQIEHLLKQERVGWIKSELKKNLDKGKK